MKLVTCEIVLYVLFPIGLLRYVSWYGKFFLLVFVSLTVHNFCLSLRARISTNPYDTSYLSVVLARTNYNCIGRLKTLKGLD